MFYVKDDTANTGREYIDNDGENVSAQSNAVAFHTKESAEEWIRTKFGVDDDWAYVCEEV